MLRKFGMIAVLSLIVTAIAAVPALAANPHATKDAVDPECTLTGDTVSCTGTEISGVGNADAVATLNISASADILCRAPGNNKVVEPHSTEFSETVSSGIIENKNGRLIVPSLSATADLAPDEFTCPNPNWREQVTNVTVTGFTYTINFVDEDGNVTENYFTTSGP